MPRGTAELRLAGRVEQSARVEAPAGEAANGRVHAVLRREHRDTLATDLEPLEERLLVVMLHRVIREDGRGQL